MTKTCFHVQVYTTDEGVFLTQFGDDEPNATIQISPEQIDLLCELLQLAKSEYPAIPRAIHNALVN